MATAEKALVMMAASSKKKRQGPAGTAVEFEQVYRQYFRQLYAFIAYRVGDRSVAEDITSQVFEKALKAFPRYDPGRASLSTWLFTIARNSISDHFRDRRKRKHNELDEADILSQVADPEVEAQALEIRQELATAFSCLSAREHEVMALKFGSGMSNREIGGLLGISETNTGTIIYRSLGKLKKELESGIEND
jgi:RNA polymerase sigma factor (sigma-70 family)